MEPACNLTSSKGCNLQAAAEKHRELILIADDDAAMRSMLRASLERRGYDVEEYGDGEALLQRLESVRSGAPAPDLIVSDVQMPGKTGLDVLHWLERSHSSVPVILITAFGDERTHQRARQLGARLIVDKPFKLSEMQHYIAETLDED